MVTENSSPEFSTSHPDKILRQPQVQEITGLSRTTIWRQEAAGVFPRRVRLGPRSVGWLCSEINDYLQSLPRRDLKIL